MDQALADLAHFITHMKTREELSNSKVFLAGASYSAAQAVWMRQKYPHLVDAVWASSGAVHAKFSFIEFKEVVAEAIKTLGGSECLERFRDAYTDMEAMILRGQTQRLEEELNLCTPLDIHDRMQISSLFGELADDVAGLVMSHQDQEIQDACTFLLDERHADAVAAYAAWTKTRVSSECYSYDYGEFIDFLSQVEWTDPANGLSK